MTNKKNSQHKDETQANNNDNNKNNNNQFINNLRAEVRGEHTLSVVENAMWSMQHLIMEDEHLSKTKKSDYEQLFNIAMPRLQRLINIFDESLPE